MFRTLLGFTALAFTTGFASAQTFVVANTFEDPQMTGGVELSTVAFKPEVFANQAAEVSADVELPNFIGFYTIDVAEDLSQLTMTVSDTASPAQTPMPVGRIDRYYYQFAGVAPNAASLNMEASTPAIAGGVSVSVPGTGRLIVEIGETAAIESGNTIVIDLM